MKKTANQITLQPSEVQEPLVLDSNTLNAMISELGAEVCHQLLELFLVEQRELRSKLVRAIKYKDLEEIANITHILKNSAELYGAQTLAQFSCQLHNNQDCPLPWQIGIAEQIVALMDRTLEEYSEYASKLAVKPSGVR